MVPVDLETRVKMVGYDHIGSYEAGIPVYIVRAKIEAEEKQKIPSVPQFVLRMIDLGFNNESTLVTALGLEKDFVRDALEFLNRNQLIVYRAVPTLASALLFGVTRDGKKAIQDALSASFVTYVDFYADGLTGEILALRPNELLRSVELDKQGIFPIHPTPGARPTVESLNSRLRTLAAVLRGQITDLPSDVEIVQFLDVAKSSLFYKKVNVLIFRNRVTTQISLRAFDGYEAVPEYDESLTRRERTGGNVIPGHLLVSAIEDEPTTELVVNLQSELERVERLEQQIQDAEAKKQEEERFLANRGEDQIPQQIVTSKTRTIQELQSEIERLKQAQGKTKLVQVSEHRDLLKKAIASAREYVVIVTPKIMVGRIDKDLMDLIKEAVKRKVWVIIGYGMPLMPNEKREDFIGKEATAEFAKLQQLDGSRLYMEWIDSHAKILLCDRQFSVVSSFNFLSYRGDKFLRKETGTYSEDPIIINQVIADIPETFKSLPKEFSSRLIAQ